MESTYTIPANPYNFYQNNANMISNLSIPTVAELLELPAFEGHTLLAGYKGLDLRVLGINLSDTPDYYPFIRSRTLEGILSY